jgi:hypothetical protein
MHEFIETRDDVLALKMSGRITGADLDAVMERLEQAWAAHDKVHIFVETASLDSIELAGLADYVPKAVGMFGKLDRFGRVAIVADQAVIRGASRLESALLPGISYRVFEPDERDVALAWTTDG